MDYGADGSEVTAVPDAGYHFVAWSDGLLTAARTDADVSADLTVTASFAIDTFTITASAGPGGAIDPSGAVSVARGADRSFTITPDAHRHLTALTLDGATDVSGDATHDPDGSWSYTLTDVTADHTLAASFALDTYTLAYTAGDHGSISGTSPQTVDYGADGSEVTAVPDAGYHFVAWSDGLLTAARTDADVSADLTVTASFAIDTFTITASAGPGGAIDPSGAVSVARGADRSFTITPDAHRHLTALTLDGATDVSGDATHDPDGSWSYTLTDVTADHTLAASFALDTYTLAYTAGDHGSISGTSPQTVDYGADGSEVTAVPDAGYHFVAWSDGLLTAARTDADVSADLTVTASFAIDTFTITASAGPGGAIDPSGAVSVARGADRSFTITPDAHRHLTALTLDGATDVSGDATHDPDGSWSYTLTDVTADHTLAASFALDTYTLAYTAGDHGSISGTSPQTVDYGADGSEVTAVPDAGYHFVAWSDGLLTAARTDADVSADLTVTASFAIDTFTITASAGPGGAIDPSGAVSVARGADRSFTITPDAHRHLTALTLDGATDVSGDATHDPDGSWSYTLTDVTADHTLAASFALDTYTLAYTAGDHGSISGTSPQTVDYGADGSEVTAVPDAGYHFVAWSDGLLTAARTDADVSADLTVTASFAIDLPPTGSSSINQGRAITYSSLVDIDSSGISGASQMRTSTDDGSTWSSWTTFAEESVVALPALPGSKNVRVQYRAGGSTPLEIAASLTLALPPIAVGGDHGIAIRTDGALFAWGHGGQGQRGDGTTTDSLWPKRAGGASDWAAPAAGWVHSFGLKTGGTLWGWGQGPVELGIPVPDSQLETPTQVGSDATWATIVAGSYFSLGLRNTGQLWDWGANTAGQLGRNTTYSPLEAGPVGTAQWATVKAGQDHAIGLQKDGTLYTWGSGWNGRLGDGSAHANTQTPTKVPGTTADWASVCAGSEFSLATKTNGELWAWGDDSHGQLGDDRSGTGVIQLTPRRIGTDTDWVALAAGRYHTLALKGDGSLWAWGDNSYGQLGDATTTMRTHPVQIGADTDWVAVAAGSSGADVSLALKADGTVWGWGRNVSGGVGDGTTIERHSPVKILDLTDSTASSVIIGRPTDGGTQTTSTPQLVFDIGDARSSTVVVKVDGTTVSTSSGQNLGALSDGTHTVSVTARDWGGNETTATSTFTVDTVGPSVTITSPADGSTVTTATPLLQYSLGPDADLGIGSVVVRVDGDVVDKTSGDTLDGLANGPHSLSVRARDAWYNLTTVTVGFTVEVPVTHAVSASAGANGAIAPAGSVIVNDGASRTFTITPDTHHHLDQLLLDGATDVSGDATHDPDGSWSYTLTDVTADHTLAASFALDSFTLTYTAGAHGSLSGTSPQTVDYGADGSEVTAVPDAGYHFVAWSDGVLTAKRTDTNVSANLTVTASFALDSFTLAYTAGDHGSISGTSPQTVDYGADGSEVTAVPDAGYHFVAWSDGVLTAKRTDTNVQGDVTVTAQFEIDEPASLTYQWVRDLPKADFPYYMSGFFQPITVDPANYLWWADDARGFFRFDGAANWTMIDYFNHLIDATDVAMGNGPSDGQVWAIDCYQKRVVRFSAGGSYLGYSPVAGTDPSGLALNSDGSYWVSNMATGDKFIGKYDSGGNLTYQLYDPRFSAPQWITLDKAGNLYVSDWGANKVFEFSPSGTPVSDWSSANAYGITFDADGLLYVVNRWQNKVMVYTAAGTLVTTFGDGTQLLNPGDIAVGPDGLIYVVDESNHRVRVYQKVVPTAGAYTVTPVARANGTITPDTAQTVASGGSQSFTITPDAHYHLDTLTLNGSDVKSAASYDSGSKAWSYTVTSVTGDRTIVAIFAIDQFNLSYTAGANGSITGDSRQTVTYGANGTAVTAVPETGYHFVKWSDGLLTAARTDANVTANVDVIAQFAADSAALPSYHYIRSYGVGGLEMPEGHAVDTAGNLYVADGDGGVEKYAPDGTSLGTIGGQGTGDGQFSWPWDVLVVGDELWVSDADFSANCIQVFSLERRLPAEDHGHLAGRSQRVDALRHGVGRLRSHLGVVDARQDGGRV